MISLELPLTKKKISSLKKGQKILLSGDIYTARDQAHKRLADLIKKNKKLPIDLEKKVIYYTGPSPAPLGKVIGSCGPTTSSRMDKFTQYILKAGVLAMIGKGKRSKEVKKIIKKHKAVYFLAPAGCGAFLSEKIENAEVVAFKDLGPEAIIKLSVKSFPLIVGIDSRGNDIYN